jgi:hypothetical protein
MVRIQKKPRCSDWYSPGVWLLVSYFFSVLPVTD